MGQPNRLWHAVVGTEDGYRAKYRGPKRPGGRETSRAVWDQLERGGGFIIGRANCSINLHEIMEAELGLSSAANGGNCGNDAGAGGADVSGCSAYDSPNVDARLKRQHV